jgi:DNA-binding NarL/FixJ family response regulator
MFARLVELSLPVVTGVKPLQVYVVEDSEIILRLLESAIESAGGGLIGFGGDAQQVIRDLQRLKPDLVLIDLVLASGTGFDVLEAMQSGNVAGNAIAAVFSNHVSPDNRARSLRLGASFVFDKSTQGREALHLINAMADWRRGRGSGHGRDQPEFNGDR